MHKLRVLLSNHSVNQHKQTNLRRHLDFLAKRLGIQTQEDWYGVQVKEAMNEGAATLLVPFNFCLSSALSSLYPEYDWNPALFCRTPKNHWKETENHRKFFDDIAERLQIETQEDWYSVDVTLIKQLGGRGVLNYYNSTFSTFTALQSVYPEFTWDSSKFQKYYESKRHSFGSKASREYLDWIAQELNIVRQEDWYNVTKDEVVEIAGVSFLKEFNLSWTTALQTIYPEFEWNELLFKANRQRWLEPENHRKFMDATAEHYGIQTQEDWYNLTYLDVSRFGGKSVLWHHNNSLARTLSDVYPEYDWLSFRFKFSPKNIWKDPHNQRLSMEWMAEQLNIEHLSEWTNVSSKSLESLGGAKLLKYYGGLANTLLSVFPDYDWKTTTLLSEGQKSLGALLKQILPERILVNYRFHDPFGNRKVELDFFVPAYSLAFEYQGGFHYPNIVPNRVAVKSLPQRDEYKRRLCNEMGITLIQVPFWWISSSSSLINTIKSCRPDIPLSTMKCLPSYSNQLEYTTERVYK